MKRCSKNVLWHVMICFVQRQSNVCNPSSTRYVCVVKYRQFCANDPFSNSGLDVKSLFQESVGFGNDEILALLYNLIGSWSVQTQEPYIHPWTKKLVTYTLWSQLLGEIFSWGLLYEKRKKIHTESFLHIHRIYRIDLPRIVSSS